MVVDAMQSYFTGEKSEAGIILLLCAILLAVAVYFLIGSRPFLKGIGTLLVVSALVGAIVGGTVYLRTDGQVSALTDLVNRDCNRFVHEEGARMDTVMKNFQMYKWGSQSQQGGMEVRHRAERQRASQEPCRQPRHSERCRIAVRPPR